MWFNKMHIYFLMGLDGEIIVDFGVWPKFLKTKHFIAIFRGIAADWVDTIGRFFGESNKVKIFNC